MEISSLRDKETRKELKEKGIHKVFIISIAVKAVFATLEVVLGLLLLFTGSVVQIVLALLENELIDDPNDFFGTLGKANQQQTIVHRMPNDDFTPFINRMYFIIKDSG